MANISGLVGEIHEVVVPDQYAALQPIEQIENSKLPEGVAAIKECVSHFMDTSFVGSTHTRANQRNNVQKYARNCGLIFRSSQELASKSYANGMRRVTMRMFFYDKSSEM